MAELSKVDMLRLRSIANWSTSLVRYYLVDYDGGSDSNLGYVDAAAGATIAPSGVPFKTLEQLLSALPAYGAGRRVVILIKPRAAGAAYLKKDGVTEDSLDVSGYHGYSVFMVRGSDLTNSATDKRVLGGMVAAAGPGAGEEWTCAAGATNWALSIASGSLTAEPALLGYRIRFTGNITSALANRSYMINANTSSAITASARMIAIPAAGDTFYIERPAVSIKTVKTPYDTSYDFVGTNLVAGIAISGSSNLSFMPNGNNAMVCFCQATAVTTNNTVANTSNVGQPSTIDNLQVNVTYNDESGTSVPNVGGGLRTSGVAQLAGVSNVSASAFLATGVVCAQFWGAFASSNSFIGGLGSVFASTVAVTNTRASANTMIGGSITPGASISFGTSGNVADWGYTKTRIFGASSLAALQVYQSSLAVHGVEITNTGSLGGIWLNAQGANLEFDDVVGSVGNNNYGILGAQAANCSIFIGRLRPVSVTGALGDIAIPQPVIDVLGPVLSYASLTYTDVSDIQGNRYFGTGGTIVGQCSTLRNSGGTSVAFGEIVRSVGVSRQVGKAQADAQAHADSPIGVAVTSAVHDQYVCIADTGSPWVQFTSAPTVGAVAYLSPTTAGQATTTTPPVSGSNRKLRLGRVLTVNGTLGRVRWHPEMLSSEADGSD